MVGIDTTDPRLTPAESAALKVSNESSSSGWCPCGMTVEQLPDRIVQRHANDCPAISRAAMRAERKLAGLDNPVMLSDLLHPEG